MFIGDIIMKNVVVIDFKKGDVTGDRVVDYVYLIGDQYEGESFTHNIRLKIVDGRTKCSTIISLKENEGYPKKLFLGDFTGDSVDDILVSIASGGSGGTGYFYVYSFLYNIPKLLFDYEKFNDEFVYQVNYMDDYKVKVISNSKNLNTVYIIDITYKGETYLSEIYDENGKLKEPITGWVDPLSSLYPIDYQVDDIYGLYGIQSIAGRYHADGLGYVYTSLKWDGQYFIPFYQTVGIYGDMS